MRHEGPPKDNRFVRVTPSVVFLNAPLLPPAEGVIADELRVNETSNYRMLAKYVGGRVANWAREKYIKSVISRSDIPTIQNEMLPPSPVDRE